MASTVVGLFDDQNMARRAMEELTSNGFPSDRISVVAADQEGAFQKHHVDDEGNIAAEGAVTGLASGAVVGGILGLLVGMGAIFIPGGILVAGPIAGLVTGAAAGAATGGILGGLIGMGIPKEHADVYAEGIRRGGVLLAVDATEREEEAERILVDCGAVDVDERSEQYRREGFTSYERDATPYTTEQAQVNHMTPAANIGADMEGLNTNTGVSGAPATGSQGMTRGTMTDSYTGLSPAVGTGSLAVPSNLSGDPGATVDQSGSLGMTDQDIVQQPPTPTVPGTTPNPVMPTADAGSPGATDPIATTSGTTGMLGFAPQPADSTGQGTVATQINGATATAAFPMETGAANTGKVGQDNTSPLLETSAHQDWGNLQLEDFHDEFDRRFSNRGMTYEQAMPAYEFGNQMAIDDRFRGKEWGSSEQDLRNDWESRDPDTWIMYRDIVRVGWDRAMARATSNRAQML